MPAIELEKVIPDDSQMTALFDLLKARKHYISHRSLPLYEDHCRFVKNHPYREWYLVRVDKKYAGSIYVGHDNSIGLNNVETLESGVFNKALEKLMGSVEPLPPVLSVRPAAFYFNVSPSNKRLMSKLEQLGYTPVQITYSIEQK